MNNIIKLNIFKKNINGFGIILIFIGIILLIFNVLPNIIGFISIMTGFLIQILFLSILNKKEESIIKKMAFVNILNDLKVTKSEREYYYFLTIYLTKVIYNEAHKKEVDEKEKMILNNFMNCFIKNISKKHFIIQSEVLNFEKKDKILNKYQQAWEDKNNFNQQIIDCKTDKIDKKYSGIKCYKNFMMTDWNLLIYKSSKICLILCAFLINPSKIYNLDPFKIIFIGFLIDSFLNN